MASILLPLFCLCGFIEIMFGELEFLSFRVCPVYFVFILEFFSYFLATAWTVLMKIFPHWWLIFLLLKDRNRVIWVFLGALHCFGNVWTLWLMSIASSFLLLALKTFGVNTINQLFLLERSHLSFGLLREQWFESIFYRMFISFIT